MGLYFSKAIFGGLIHVKKRFWKMGNLYTRERFTVKDIEVVIAFYGKRSIIWTERLKKIP
jgi:hypothetical protein